MSNKSINIGAFPIGTKGILVGRIMNLIHKNSYKRIIDKYIIEKAPNNQKETVLDIGCGGGVSVNLLCKYQSVKRVCAIDYSNEMVMLSCRINRKEIEKNRAEIVQGDVSNIPFSDSSFSVVTAFDTINFWQQHKKALAEIFRVLKNGGRFLIINAYPKPNMKWYTFVKFKSNKDYEDLLSSNRFSNTSCAFEGNTIIVSALKK